MISKSKFNDIAVTQAGKYMEMIFNSYKYAEIILVDSVVYQRYTAQEKYYSSSIVSIIDTEEAKEFKKLYADEIFKVGTTSKLKDEEKQRSEKFRSYENKAFVKYFAYNTTKNPITTIFDQNYERNEIEDLHPNDWFDFFEKSEINVKTNYCSYICYNEPYSDIRYLLFIYSNHIIKEEDLKSLQLYNTSLGVRISALLNDYYLDSLKKTSLKSSLAAVMARNMSHNIGSHVLNKMSQKSVVDNFYQDAKDGKFYLNYSNGNETLPYATPHNIYTLSPFFGININDVNTHGDKDKKATLSHEELSRVFNDYLKKRMDFVADVATSDIATLTNNKYLFKEIFKNFERNLLLLQNISGKENKFNYSFAFEYCENNEIKKPDEEGFIDPLIAMPNDVLGDQAFYIILENIIRNTAKHSQNSDDVVFTIRVTNFFDNFYKITIYDSVTFETNEELIKLILERNNNIATSVLDDDNEIRKNGWGTIELKLAACYLSKVSVTKIDELKYAPLGYNIYRNLEKENIDYGTLIKNWKEFIISTDIHEFKQDDNVIWTEKPSKNFRIINNKCSIPILQAQNVKEKSGFGYNFLLKKPQEIFVVLPVSLVENYNKKKSEFKKIGVEIISTRLFKEKYISDTSNKEKKRLVAHHDLLFIDSDLMNEISINETNLPQRQLILENSILPNLKEILDSEAIDKNTLHSLEYLFWKKRNRTKYKISSQNFEEIFVQDKDSTKDESLMIKLDHHGYQMDKNAAYYEPYGSVSIINNYLNAWKTEYQTAYREEVIGRNITFLKPADRNNFKISNSNLNKYREIYRGKLIEAAETKIMFIDERIQGVLPDFGFTAENNGKETKIEYWKLFSKSKIIVPPLDIINLNEKPILKSDNDWENLLNYFSNETENIDYLVIHFGLLESFRSEMSERKTVTDVLDAIKKQFKENNNLKLIITSGRGTTPDVRELNLPFVSYSAISNYTIDPNNRSKFHLVNLLKSIRL